MKDFNRKKHWEKIYTNKNIEDTSWYQKEPITALSFIKKLNINKTSKIIDVGGGDSFLVDHLLDLGFENLTVLDISATAIHKAKQRLGEKGNKVNWIVADAANFKPSESYDFWYDRAAFHFLTEQHEIENYINTVQDSLNLNGHLVIGTFSEEGPKKCSGIEIRQYSEQLMTKEFEHGFKKIECIKVAHKTPSDAIQNFIFCSFQKLNGDR